MESTEEKLEILEGKFAKVQNELVKYRKQVNRSTELDHENKKLKEKIIYLELIVNQYRVKK